MAIRPLVVIGTRPEAIKLAPVCMELRKRGIRPFGILTGQHDIDRLMQIDSHFDGPFQHFEAWGVQARELPDIMLRVSRAIANGKPTHVAVQGDTTSALAGALAGFYAKIPVVHVEAGLRTYDMAQPFPEEFNRRAITLAATLHCCPTKRAMDVIGSEFGHELRGGGATYGLGWTRLCFERATAILTGNTAIDALKWTMERLDEESFGRTHADILVTMHRRENWQHAAAVHAATLQLSEQFKVRWIDHPNPQSRPHDCVSTSRHQHLAPHPYDAMVSQMSRCRILLTDSGGIQEEAPTLGKPCLILRDKTERPEAIECGAAKLVGTDPATIIAEATRLLTDDAAYRAMQVTESPFGDGHAAERIVDAIEKLA